MHPQTERIYKEHGFTDLPPDPQTINRTHFEQNCLGDTIKVRIDNIVRKKVGAKGGEFVLYHMTKIGQNIHGRPVYQATLEGHYPKPHFDSHYNPETGQVEESSKVLYHEDVYEIPYSPENVKKILDMNEFDNEIGLTLDLGHKKMSVSDINDFIILPLNQLVQKLEQQEQR